MTSPSSFLARAGRRSRPAFVFLSPRQSKRPSTPSRAFKSPTSNKGLTKERPLPVEFDLGEWHFAQVCRHGRFCLYVKAKTGGMGKPIQSWELVMPRLRNERLMPSGKRYPARECYPKDDDWGRLAWTYVSEADALAALERRSKAEVRHV